MKRIITLSLLGLIAVTPLVAQDTPSVTSMIGDATYQLATQHPIKTALITTGLVGTIAAIKKLYAIKTHQTELAKQAAVPLGGDQFYNQHILTLSSGLGMTDDLHSNIYHLSHSQRYLQELVDKNEEKVAELDKWYNHMPVISYFMNSKERNKVVATYMRLKKALAQLRDTAQTFSQLCTESWISKPQS